MTTETTVPTPQQVLLRAADIITERGWTQGDYFNADGCVCAVGAIGIAAAEAVGVTDETAQRLATRMVGGGNQALRGLMVAAESLVFVRIRRAHPDGIVFWNDADGRAADEVVAVLRAAAEEAK